jgi:hypothetical protein
MELTVELPMLLYVDNKGAKDLMNNWSVGGRTRHVDVRYHFLRELKEKNIIRINWISTHANCADMFTKNLQGPLFNKHAQFFCGKDNYGNCESDNSQGEGVRMKYNGTSSTSVKYDSNDGIKGNTTGVKVIKTQNKFGTIKNNKEAEVDHGTTVTIG